MKNPRHIVIDARIRPDSTGRYADRLLAHLQNIDSTNNYTVILRKDDDWEPEAPNFKVKRVGFPQFSFNPWDQIAFPWILYRLKPDVIHFCMTQYPLLYFGNIVVTTHDTTMLYHTHKKDRSALFHWLKDRGYRLLMWAGHRKAKKIIVPTYAVKKDLVKHQRFTLPKLEVTHESSEPPLPVTAQKPELMEPDDEFIVYVGTAFPHKNRKRLIDAFEYLANKHPKLKLVHVGKIDFFYEEVVEYARTKTHLYDRIKFLGFVSDEELKWVYQSAKLYVFPSLMEGFGLPPLEAMNHGLAVVASDIPVLREVLEDATVYFDPEDPKDIAKVVHEVLSDDAKRKELIRRGNKQIKKFSWERMAQETKKIYEDALAD